MSLELPEPAADDVWGNQLNEAITGVGSVAAAAQAAALNAVNVTTTDASGNPIINYGVNSAAVLLATSVGQPGGVASLDSGGQIPKIQMGNLSYTDVGAAAAQHTHALKDLPDVSKALDASPAIALFNTGTQKWPSRISLTTSATRSVIWWGDATIPSDAVPNVDMFFGPTASGGTATNPIPVTPPTNTPDPVTGIALSTPTVATNGSLYNLSAVFTNGSTPTNFAYIQLAVRGPNGEQQDTGFNVNAALAAAQTLTVTGSGSAGSTGSWKAYLSYNTTGGTSQASWIDGPAVTFTISTTGGGIGGGSATGSQSNIPLIGRSGLPWNDGIFYNGGQVTDANAFAQWRNRPLDSIMYFTGRASWNDIMWMRDDLTAWPGYRIVCVPSQPEPMDNSSTANGSNNAFWTSYGLALKNKGWNDGRTIIRLNWEANGNWYDWNWGKGGGPSAFVNAYKNVVNSIRINAPKTIFDLTVNKSSRDAGNYTWQTDIYLPLVNHFDIVGLDWYDHGPAQTTQSAFDSAAAQDPGGESVAAFCRAHSKVMWLQECGLSWGAPPAYYGGQDDPGFWDKMWVWVHNNLDIFAGMTTYNDKGTGNPPLMHSMFNPNYNPNGANEYKLPTRWGG